MKTLAEIKEHISRQNSCSLEDWEAFKLSLQDIEKQVLLKDAKHDAIVEEILKAKGIQI